MSCCGVEEEEAQGQKGHASCDLEVPPRCPFAEDPLRCYVQFRQPVEDVIACFHVHACLYFYVQG